MNFYENAKLIPGVLQTTLIQNFKGTGLNGTNISH